MYPVEFHIRVKKLKLKGVPLTTSDRVYFLWSGRQSGIAYINIRVT